MMFHRVLEQGGLKRRLVFRVLCDKLFNQDLKVSSTFH